MCGAKAETKEEELFYFRTYKLSSGQFQQRFSHITAAGSTTHMFPGFLKTSSPHTQHTLQAPGFFST